MKLKNLKQSVDEGMNPRDAKFELAMEITARFHSQSDAERARQVFIDRFRKGAVPEDMPEKKLEAGPEGLPIANMLKLAELVSSTSEAIRMIKQGAVKIGGEKVDDPKLRIEQGAQIVVQVGKRKWAQISVL